MIKTRGSTSGSNCAVSSNDWISPGQITGIGSLPHTKPEEAMALIQSSLARWPHWPQLPAVAQQEGFVQQYVHPLQSLGLLSAAPGKDPVFNAADENRQEAVTEFYQQYLSFVESPVGNNEQTSIFQLDKDFFRGLYAFERAWADGEFPRAVGVKGQISGPLTIGLQIKDRQQRAAFFDDTLRDLLIKTLVVQGMLQIERLVSSGKPVLIFIDDPSLFLLGASTHITLTREDLQQALREMIDAFHGMGARVGVHACAGIDWSLLFELSLDVISFDAYEFFQGMALQADGLQAFLSRGGRLAWGLVPTSTKAWQETTLRLKELAQRQWAELDKREVDVQQLSGQVIWTPSCGTGALDVALAEHIYKLLAGLEGYDPSGIL